MRQRKLRLLSVVIIAALLALVGCTTEGEPDTDTDTIEFNDEAINDDGLVEVEGNSDNLTTVHDGDLTLTLRSAINLETPPAAEAGTLILAISITNEGNETTSLELDVEDYVVTSAAGLSYVPTAIDDALVMTEIAAGESVTGEIEYAVPDADGTYDLVIGNFEGIVFDPTAET